MSSSPPAPDLPGKLATALPGAVVGLAGGVVWLATGATTATWMQAVLLSLLALLALALGARHPSYRALTPLGVLAFAPLLFRCARAALDVPLIGDGCPLDNWHGLLPTAFAIVGLPALVLSGALAFLLARVLVKRERRWLAALLHAASLAASVGALLLVAAAAPRALRHPAPSGYVDSLPSVGVIPPAQGEPTSVKRIDFPERSHSMKAEGVSVPTPLTTRIYEHPFAGDLLARRYCRSFSGPECLITIIRRSQRSEVEARRYTDPRLGTAYDFPLFSCGVDNDLKVAENTPVLVREDAGRDLLIFETPTFLALRRSSLTITRVGLNDLLDVTSSPRGCFAVGVAGVLLALALLFHRRRAQRRLARLNAAPTGVLGEDGWITFDEAHPPLRAPLDTRVPSGPVLVLPGVRRRAVPDPYRGHEPPTTDAEVLPGKREDILARERRALDGLVAYPLAIVLFTALPLAAETALRMTR